jgi:chromosome segregation ATPase
MKEEKPFIRYEKLSKEDLVDYCRVYWRRIHNDEELFNEIYKDIESLKSDVSVYKSQMNAYKKKYLALLKSNTELVEENRNLRDELQEWLNAVWNK